MTCVSNYLLAIDLLIETTLLARSALELMKEW